MATLAVKATFVRLLCTTRPSIFFMIEQPHSSWMFKQARMLLQSHLKLVQARVRSKDHETSNKAQSLSPLSDPQLSSTYFCRTVQKMTWPPTSPSNPPLANYIQFP